MHGHDLVGFVAVTAIFLIPSLAIFTRFALRPIVESIVRLRGLPAAPGVLPPADDGRVAALEEEVHQLRESLERVSALVEFDAQLRVGSATTPVLPPGRVTHGPE